VATLRTFQLVDNATVLSNFKSWAMSISSALSSFGWLKSADTGQVNWSTISVTPTNSTPVFEIWKANDSLASTLPIFIKVWYLVTATSPAGPTIELTFGTGSNGAGTLTNATATITLNSVPASQTNLSYECDYSGSSGRFACCMFQGWSGCFFFSVERSHDASANDTGSYFTFLAVGSLNTGVQQTVRPSSAGGPLPAESSPITVHTSNTTGIVPGGDASLSACPVWPMVGGLGNPLLNAVSVKTNDVAGSLIVPVSLYGTARNYLIMKTLNSGSIGRLGGSTGLAMLCQ
jgi:hypothetical protein